MKTIFALLCVALLAGCATHNPPQHYAWVTGLKTDQAAHYENLHAHVWPGVNKMIKSCHIHNFSIHECEINGRLYLFAYLEYTGTNFEADMNAWRTIPKPNVGGRNRSLPVAAAGCGGEGKIWTDTKEVYFLP